jgi:hypothetical protein
MIYNNRSKLQQMLKENPAAFRFYERYKEIVEDYNMVTLEDTIATLRN